MPDSQPRKVACPTCGASLLFGAGEVTTRCQFCNAVVERPLQAGQSATVKPERDKSGRPRSATHAAAADSSTVFIRAMFLLGISVILLVIAIAVVFITQRVSQSGLNLHISGPVAVLATDTPDEPEFIALAFDYTGDSAYLFARLNPAQGKVVWRGKEFEDISDVRTIVAADGKFFAVEGAELHAYKDTDGSQLWQAPLSDELGYCDECLSVAGGRAFALTQDYVIQAFDTGTGAVAWTRRMDGYTEGFTLADGGLWVIDRVDGTFSLFLLNADDGAVLKRITPECRRADGATSSPLDAISPFLLDPDPSVRSDERSVYLLYGYYPGCVERWDAASAARLWQAGDDEGFSPSRDFATLFTEDALFFSYENTLWVAAKADGKVRVLSEGGDYHLVPLAFEQGTLILRTKRTRGTAQFGLRGLDPESGETLWEHPIPKSEPADPPDAAFQYVGDDSSIWGWRMIEGRLRLFVFQSDPNQITFDTLDPKTGNPSDHAVLALPIEDDGYFGPEILVWRGTALWFVADGSVMAVDVSTAVLKTHFP